MQIASPTAQRRMARSTTSMRTLRCRNMVRSVVLLVSLRFLHYLSIFPPFSWPFFSSAAFVLFRLSRISGSLDAVRGPCGSTFDNFVPTRLSSTPLTPTFPHTQAHTATSIAPSAIGYDISCCGPVKIVWPPLHLRPRSWGPCMRPSVSARTVLLARQYASHEAGSWAECRAVSNAACTRPHWVPPSRKATATLVLF